MILKDDDLICPASNSKNTIPALNLYSINVQQVI